MSTPKRQGQIIGVMLLFQMAFGLILPFVLIQGPLSITPPGFLVNAAANSTKILIAVFVAFVGGGLTLAIAITARPVFRPKSETLAVWFFAMCLVSLVMDALHNAAVLSMLSLSERYVEMQSPNEELYLALAGVVRNARYWAHYVQLLFIGGWIFTFYTILFRFSLVPRVLAALGLLAILLQFFGVTLSGFVGYPMLTQLAMPMAPVHFSTGLYLIIKGFRE